VPALAPPVYFHQPKLVVPLGYNPIQSFAAWPEGASQLIVSVSPRLAELGLAVSAKIDNETEVVWLMPPPLPVIATAYEPAGVVSVVLIVMTVVPEPLIEVGLKLALAPVGSPLTLQVTAPPNPFVGVTVRA